MTPKMTPGFSFRSLFMSLAVVSVSLTCAYADANGSKIAAYPGLPGDGGFPGFGNLPGLGGFPGTSQPSEAADGANKSGTFSNEAGSRAYTVFVPKQPAAHPGMLVILHGCIQTGANMATGTQMNSLAAKKGFLVLYPEQTYQDNNLKCWNWYQPENQQRGGELSILAGMAQDVASTYQVDLKQIYVAGLSAGGAMAANLLACYSDVFAGGLIHSGLEFAAAQSQNEAQLAMSNGASKDLNETSARALKCSPPRSKLIPVIVIQGKDDHVVSTVNSGRIATFFELLNGLIDSTQQITHSDHHLNEAGKLAADETDTLFGDKVLVKKIMVDGMGHAWSGGQSGGSYMEPRGPSASQILVDTFFN